MSERTTPIDVGAKAAIAQAAARLAPDLWKYANELRFWVKIKRREGRLHNAHYREAFVRLGVDEEAVRGTTMLDLGCGPRGSLEWATTAAARYGVDPLASVYARMSPDHAMTYVRAPAEAIPFPDDHIDILSSFNSLDHVGDVTTTLEEVARVLRPGGLLLLITDFGHDPTPCEPQAFGVEVLDHLADRFEVEDVATYAKQGPDVYRSIREGQRCEVGELPSGVLCCRARRR